MHAKENEVIQLASDLDPAYDSVFICEAFGSLQELLILIVRGLEQPRKG